jgi:hypothetical protein
MNRIKDLKAMKTKNTNKPVFIPCHSVGRLSGLFCWPQGQDINNNPAQRHSKFSKPEKIKDKRKKIKGKR